MKPKKAFTLVELIVVIVILAILATIAFLSFNNYSTSARDSRRMNNVTIISKGLDMSIALGRNINTSEAGTGSNILIVGSGGISYSGYYMNIGNKLLSSIQVSGGDILSDTFQKYQLTYIPDKKYYQVMGLLEKQVGTVYEENYISIIQGKVIPSKEGQINYFLDNNLGLISKVYSTTTSSGFAFIKGNFPVNTSSGGYIKGLIPKDYTNAPIINSIPTISGTGDIVIPAEIISSGGGYVITGGGGGGGGADSCNSGNYSSAGTQTYNLPSTITDSSNYTGTTSTGITNGTKTYTATMSCSNGTITVTNETYTGSCNINYSWNGSSCIATVYKSCNAIKTAVPASTDGIYTIDPDGTLGNTAFQVYCDMTSDGGGWTLVFKQSDFTMSTSENSIANLLNNNYLTDGNGAKYADNIINLINYSLIRGEPEGATKFYFTKDNAGIWDLGGCHPVTYFCENWQMNLNCIDRNGGDFACGYFPVAGYTSWVGIQDHSFMFNHHGNLGYGARTPYGYDSTNFKVFVK